MHFKHEMIGKKFTETSNKVEPPMNHARINHVQPVHDMIKTIEAYDEHC